jgi:hypothetical protein
MHIMVNGAAFTQWHTNHGFARSFRRFFHRIGYFFCFARAIADTTFAIAHNHNRGEAKATTTFHHLRNAVDGDQTMKILSNYKNANSPRGPISIDPATRDIVQNVYIKMVEEGRDGKLYNKVIETTPAVKDPWKEAQKK